MMSQKQHNDFVVSLAGANIDTTIINIEEMNEYCNSRGRIANVVTEKQTYGKLESMNYSLAMNYTKPNPRVINSKSKPYIKVYSSLLENYKNGLLIVESDTISGPVSELLCNSEWLANNDVDIMICRHGLSSMTEDEMKMANLLRISADPEFDPSILQRVDKIYEEKVLTLMICQLFVNEQYDNVNKYLDSQSKHYSSQGMGDCVNYYELNKQLAYFIYYDVAADKILNVSKATIISFIQKLSKAGILPIPDDKISEVANMICLS